MSSLESEKSGSGGKNIGARAMFQALDKHGVKDTTTKVSTTHQNQISSIQILSGDKSNADQISTSGGDGKVVVWNIRNLEKEIQALKI